MLEFGIDRTNELIRQTLRDLNQAKIEEESAAVNEAIAFFDRQTDHASIRAAMKQRFAIGIEKTATGYDTYTRGLTGEQIDQGFFETVTSGVGNKVIDSLANMFTAPTQSWQYVSADDEPNDDAETLINSHRKVGGASTSLVNTDSLSCAVNTAFFLVDWVGGHLKYRVVSPTALHAIYNEFVEDNGVQRAVDYGEIEDATVIVITLSTAIEVDPSQNQYLAIFGRSEEYEFGRYVTYRASQWDSIPDIGQGGNDYVLEGGQIGNPLSWLANQNPDQMIPDYPIIKFDGGLMRTANDLIETTTSMYENMLEIDLAYSRLLKESLSGARGSHVITNELSSPLPSSLEGAIALHSGQKLEIMGRPSINSKFALDVLEGLVVAVGNGYSVPDYVLVSDPVSLSASSGVALAIRTKPLIKFRDYRLQINTPQVEKLWLIEKSLIETHTGEQGLRDIQQIWQPGDLEIPEDQTEKVARIKAAEDAQYIDHVAAMKEYHGLATDAEAEALIIQYRERAEEFAPEQPQQAVRGAQPVGLTRAPV